MCLILLKLAGYGGPGGNQPNVVSAIRVNNHQHTTLSVRPKRYPSRLGGVRLGVGNRDGLWIVEYQYLIGKTDTVIYGVLACLHRIPDDFHACSIHLYARQIKEKNMQR